MNLVRTFALAAAIVLPFIAHAENSCRYSELLSLPITKLPHQGTFEVRGKINGVSVNMGLSTGSNRSHLSRKEMVRQGIPMEETRLTSYSSEKVQTVFEAQPAEVAIGPLRAENKRFLVIDMAQNSRFSATLGADFLLQTDMELFLSKEQIKFFKAENCAERGLSYWDPDAVVVPLASGKNERPVINVTINGVKGRALIDTGTARSVVLVHFAKLAGFKPLPGETPYKYFDARINDHVNIWKADFEEFAIDNEVIRKPQLSVSSIARPRDRTYDMILGLDFLMAHRLLISVSQEKVYLSYIGGEVFSSAQKW